MQNIGEFLFQITSNHKGLTFKKQSILGLTSHWNNWFNAAVVEENHILFIGIWRISCLFHTKLVNISNQLSRWSRWLKTKFYTAFSLVHIERPVTSTSTSNVTLRGKWVCNRFCLSQFPSKRSKVPPVNVTLWRSVWMSLYIDVDHTLEIWNIPGVHLVELDEINMLLHLLS